MRSHRTILIAAVVVSLGYASVPGRFSAIGAAEAAGEPVQQATEGKDGLEKATFAAGCFWCVEADFDKLKGVVSTTSGFIGGRVPNPTYEQVSSGGTGHTEAVEILFDPAVVTYDQLLEHFWKNVDPFAAHRQFCDVGEQYRPEIFVHGAAQRAAAEASKQREQSKFQERIVVDVTDAPPFYRAEAYHQDYYEKNPLRYRYYRWRCGRDARLEEIAELAAPADH